MGVAILSGINIKGGEMSKAVIFNGINALDFEELRWNAIRVPEVLTRVKKAQSIWDQMKLPSFDLLNFIGSEDKIFLNNIKLKSLASAIVQVGLFDRYLSKHDFPEFLVGDINADSAVNVCLGLISFEELIVNSMAVVPLRSGDQNPVSDKFLSGMGLQKLKVYKCRAKKNLVEYDEVCFDDPALNKIIRHLVDECKIKTFINIGPGSNFNQLRAHFEMEDLLFLESIDQDPMLNWFWAQYAPTETGYHMSN